MTPRPRTLRAVRRLGTSLAAACVAVPLAVSASQAAPQPVAPAAPLISLPATPTTATVTRYVKPGGANVRSGPGTNYREVGSYSQGTKLTGTMTRNGWLKVRNGRYVSSYVLSSRPGSSKGSVTRYVKSTAANVRSGPSVSRAVVARKAHGDKVTGTVSTGGWLKIGTRKYISPVVLSSTRPGTKTRPPRSGGTGHDIANKATDYLGILYRYGGATPAGFDCSGYVQYVHKRVGINVPRTASAQQRASRRVSRPEVGDMVFWGRPAHHVGIYAGNGQIYDSGKPGLRTQKRKMFSGVSNYGRVTG